MAIRKLWSNIWNTNKQCKWIWMFLIFWLKEAISNTKTIMKRAMKRKKSMMIKVNLLKSFIRINMIKNFIKKYTVNSLKHCKIARWIHSMILLIVNHNNNLNNNHKCNKHKTLIIPHNINFQVIHPIHNKAILNKLNSFYF